MPLCAGYWGDSELLIVFWGVRVPVEHVNDMGFISIKEVMGLQVRNFKEQIGCHHL